jgi:hypothetical protein
VFFYIKGMRSGECTLIRKTFEQAFISRSAPEGMLLARTRHEQPGCWYLMWLSAEKDNQALHHNFALVEPQYLPKAAALLIGHRRTFERFFTYEKLSVLVSAPRW